MNAALRGADVHSLAEKLPDISPDSPAFFPCMTAEMREVSPLARCNVSPLRASCRQCGPDAGAARRPSAHRDHAGRHGHQRRGQAGSRRPQGTEGNSRGHRWDEGPGGTGPRHAEPFEHGLPLYGGQCRFSTLRRFSGGNGCIVPILAGRSCCRCIGTSGFPTCGWMPLLWKNGRPPAGKACWTSVRDRAMKPRMLRDAGIRVDGV